MKNGLQRMCNCQPVLRKSRPPRQALYNFEFLILNFELICARLPGQINPAQGAALSVMPQKFYWKFAICSTFE
jgi:hypothetical protein